ncbi:HD domain-containing protein [Candidatus Woesearchaeota archaeon]|nr:HD domain-containing protein [Candidatus Woesearchaeota archaeon]
METYINQLRELIEPYFKLDNTGHDMHHLERVHQLALKIQEKEGGDRLVIGVAAFMHDFHRLMQLESGRYHHPRESLPKIREFLKKVGCPSEEQILHCIEHHEEYRFTKTGLSTGDKESLIVQDADNLDAIGAIGIARTFYYSGANKVPMSLPITELLPYEECANDASTIHHIKRKLLKLKDHMNTETGKKLAEIRHQRLKHFLAEFQEEWESKM